MNKTNKKYKLVKVAFSNCGNDILDIEIVEGTSKKQVIKQKFESFDKKELKEDFGKNWKDWVFINDDEESICIGEENGIYCLNENEDESVFLEDCEDCED